MVTKKEREAAKRNAAIRPHVEKIAKPRLSGKAGLAIAAATGAAALYAMSGKAKADDGKVKSTSNASDKLKTEMISGAAGGAVGGGAGAGIMGVIGRAMYTAGPKAPSRYALAGAAIGAIGGALLAYQTKDGRTVQATKAQVDAWGARRKGGV